MNYYITAPFKMDTKMKGLPKIIHDTAVFKHIIRNAYSDVKILDSGKDDFYLFFIPCPTGWTVEVRINTNGQCIDLGTGDTDVLINFILWFRKITSLYTPLMLSDYEFENGIAILSTTTSEELRTYLQEH